MRPFTRTVPANSEVYLPVRGDTIYLQSSTGEVFITARDDTGDGQDTITGVAFTEDSRIRTRSTFNQVRIENTTGSDIPITVLIGFGLYEQPPTAVQIGVPSGVGGGRVTADAAGVQLVAANANRKRIYVGATWDGANGAIVAASQADAVADDGAELQPGVALVIETTAALWVARDGASDVEVWYFEETA